MISETPSFPPDEYMALVGNKSGPEQHDEFRAIGNGIVDTLEQHGMLGAAVRFLDIGCGCGRIARYLLEKPLAAYVGFDRHRGMIDWCRREIGAHSSRFDFLYFDIKSGYQNVDGQEGAIAATEFRFPFEDGAFDSVLLASVFTHMPLVEIRHYLGEIHRVSSPGGAVLLSVFLHDGDDDVTYDGGMSFHMSRRVFLDAVRASRFHYTYCMTGRGHNWYVLRPLPIEFDPNVYLAIHKDVGNAGVDAAQHYVFYGCKQGRRLR